jgi:hypothetical protein
MMSIIPLVSSKNVCSKCMSDIAPKILCLLSEFGEKCSFMQELKIT